MQSSEPPFDGPSSSDGTPPYEWLDEWLCEYVDGTMDPSLEAVFEEYVEANPELKTHVERLRQTRELLCNCDMAEDAPAEAQAEVCCQVEDDLLQSSASLSEMASERPAATFGIASSVAAALLIGFLAGSMLVEWPPPNTYAPADTVGQRQQSTVGVEAPLPDRWARSPLPPPTGRDSMGQSSVLSAVGDP